MSKKESFETQHDAGGTSDLERRVALLIRVVGRLIEDHNSAAAVAGSTLNDEERALFGLQPLGGKMTRAAFFDRIRTNLFDGSLTQPQVDGTEAILNACERERLSEAETAYVLSTAYHETAHTMQPVREALGRSEAEAYHKVYNWLRRRGGTNYAKIDRETGQSYLGRGFVQLTWRENYRRAGERLGVDLEGNPELALQPSLAARILVEGMKGGWFTGRKLADYALPQQFREARQIVNRMDKADTIAGYAEAFRQAIRGF